MLSSFFISIYVIQTKPFIQPARNLLEIFNELCILVVSYHIFLFTDYVPDPDLKYIFGWCMILITLVNILGNSLAMLCSTFTALKHLWYTIRARLIVMKFLKPRVRKYETHSNVTISNVSITNKKAGTFI